MRPTARIFEEYALGLAESNPPAEALNASGPGLEVRAWTDASTYRPYQQVRLHVQLTLPSETHVFAAPVPDGYTPLSLEVDALDGLSVGQPEFPTPKSFTVEGLEEKFQVFEGALRLVLPLQFTKNLGSAVVPLRVEYQACTPAVCSAPTTLHVEVPLNGLDLIRD